MISLYARYVPLICQREVLLPASCIALIALAAALGLLLPRRVQVEADAPSLTDAQLAVITPSGESLTPEPAAAQPTFGQ